MGNGDRSTTDLARARGGSRLVVLLTVTALLALLGVLLGSEPGRQFLRWVKYEVILGQPLIAGVPREPVSCAALAGPGTLVVLAFGQSNAANYGAGRYQPAEAVYSFYRGGCYRATDPMPGADGGGGSVWSRLGDLIVRQGLARNVVFATIGVGGSEIARWSIGGDLHGRLLGTVAELRAAGLPPTHLFWHQGEADRLKGTSAAAYRQSFQDMLGNLRRHGVGAPIYVAVATYCDGQGSGALQRAQHELVDIAGKVYPGPDSDAMTEAGVRYDDCHFSTIGLHRHAEAWLLSLRAHPG
jgi:hypothetical protein